MGTGPKTDLGPLCALIRPHRRARDRVRAGTVLGGRPGGGRGVWGKGTRRTTRPPPSPANLEVKDRCVCGGRSGSGEGVDHWLPWLLPVNGGAVVGRAFCTSRIHTRLFFCVVEVLFLCVSHLLDIVLVPLRRPGPSGVLVQVSARPWQEDKLGLHHPVVSRRQGTAAHEEDGRAHPCFK